ncbi:hypothetical protein JG687_00012537, partial [Phytophthora cactorum]
ELETRLRTLKRTHGNDLSRFPPCFFTDTRSRRPSTSESVFGFVTIANVRQRAVALHENAGELLPQALFDVITIIGEIGLSDVFLDIGCGIENVVAQFALQTSVKRCIGIEIHPELSQLGGQLIKRYSNVQPLLKKMVILCGDAKEAGLSVRPPYCYATSVYLNRFLFVDDVNVFVLRELCLLPRARVIISTAKFCPRLRTPCRNEFCATWQLHRAISGQASWTIKPGGIYIYKRQEF